MKAKQLTTMALFAALTALCAQLVIPIPFSPTPLSLSLVAVFLCGAVQPKRYGALSQVVYLLIGAVGVPVFSAFGAGLGKLFGPTGGYLLAYPVMAFVIGWMMERRAGQSFWSTVLAMAAALGVCYVMGAGWMAVSLHMPLGKAVVAGALVFLPVDAIKIVLCAHLAGVIKKRI